MQGYHKGKKQIYDNDSIKTDDDKVEEFRRIIKLCKDKGIKLYHTVDHLNSDGADKFTKKVA